MSDKPLDERLVIFIGAITFGLVDTVNRWIQMYFHINRLFTIGIIGLIGIHGTVRFLIHCSSPSSLIGFLLFAVCSLLFTILFLSLCAFLLFGMFFEATDLIPVYSKDDDEKHLVCGTLFIVGSAFTLIVGSTQDAYLWWPTFSLLTLVAYLFEASDINPEDRIRLFKDRRVRQNSP